MGIINIAGKCNLFYVFMKYILCRCQGLNP
jgi:hypothetical protein